MQKSISFRKEIQLTNLDVIVDKSITESNLYIVLKVTIGLMFWKI